MISVHNLTKYFKNRILCTTGVSSKRLPPFVCHPIYWGDMYSRPTWRLSEVVVEQARPPCTKSKGHDKGALVGHISNYFCAKFPQYVCLREFQDRVYPDGQPISLRFTFSKMFLIQRNFFCTIVMSQMWKKRKYSPF